MWRSLSRGFRVAAIAGTVTACLSGCGVVAVGAVGHHSTTGRYTPGPKTLQCCLSGTITGEAHTAVVNTTSATLTFNNEITDETDVDCGVLGEILSCTTSVTEAEWSAPFGTGPGADLHLYGYPMLDVAETAPHPHSVILHVTSCTYSDLTPCTAILNQDAKWGYVAESEAPS